MSMQFDELKKRLRAKRCSMQCCLQVKTEMARGDGTIEKWNVLLPDGETFVEIIVIDQEDGYQLYVQNENNAIDDDVKVILSTPIIERFKNAI